MAPDQAEMPGSGEALRNASTGPAIRGHTLAADIDRPLSDRRRTTGYLSTATDTLYLPGSLAGIRFAVGNAFPVGTGDVRQPTACGQAWPWRKVTLCSPTWTGRRRILNESHGGSRSWSARLAFLTYAFMIYVICMRHWLWLPAWPHGCWPTG